MGHRHIVFLGGETLHLLDGKGHPNARSFRAQLPENPVVVAFPTAQAGPGHVEGQAGTETNVDLDGPHQVMAGRIRFPDPEAAGRHRGRIGHLVKLKASRGYPGIGKRDGAGIPMQAAQVDFRAEGGIHCHSHRARPGAQPAVQVPDDPFAPGGPLTRVEIGEENAKALPLSSLFFRCRGICHLRIGCSAKSIASINMRNQATGLLLFLLCPTSPVGAQEEEHKVEYQAPVVEKMLFNDSIGMFEQERREYAANLAIYAANQVSAKKADEESLQSARRILALALQLDRRNRQAMVVNFQLKQGILPEVKKGDYNPRTFSRLLLSRAKLLERHDDEREKLLARCFVELAALIDPRNEDAVFAYENQRIDSGEIDWRIITDAVKDKPSRSPGKDE